jgi:peptide/nickel transport system ATP-binding protein
MLELDNIKKSYSIGMGRKKQVLTNLTFTLESNRVTGLAGPSGCGKSTLGRLILRLEKPDQGRILYQGRDIRKLDQKRRRYFRRKVQMVPQHPDAAFNPRLKISSSLKEIFRFHDICSKEEQNSYLEAALTHVCVHPDLLHRYPAQLSGGEIQRLAIARAILTKPDLLVLDEVTSMLDVSVQAAVIHTLKALHKDHGTAYLFITHNIILAKAFCHRIVVLENGSLTDLVN